MKTEIKDNNLKNWSKNNNPQLLKEWDYKKNEKEPFEYKPKSGKKVWWKCKKGHEWQAVIESRTDIGTNCPYCSGRYPIPGKTDLETWCRDNNIDLLKEWDYKRNGKVPSEYMPKSGSKVWWICGKGHEWQAIINDRIGGERGCPYCANKKVLQGFNDLKTKYPKAAKEWNHDKNEGILPTKIMYTSSKKVWWKCEKGHEWQTKIYLRTVNHYNCPYCSGQLPILGENDLKTWCEDNNLRLLDEWDYDKNKKCPFEYTSKSGKKVWWRCKNGHEWEAKISLRTVSNENCPYCSGRYAIKGENDLVTLFPKIVDEWDYDRNEGFPFEYMPKSGKKMWWRCKEGHEWQATIYNRTNKNSGCPYCSGRKAVAGETDLETVFPDIATEWNYERNTDPPNMFLPYSNKKVWWKCKAGHEWKSKIYDRSHGKGCPVCYTIRAQY